MVSPPTTKFEYRSLANAVAELSWIQSILKELQVVLPSTPIICYDNASTNNIVANPVMHARMKHVEID